MGRPGKGTQEGSGYVKARAVAVARVGSWDPQQKNGGAATEDMDCLH